MNKTKLRWAAAAGVIVLAATAGVLVYQTNRPTWTIRVENVGAYAHLEQCIDSDQIEETLAAPTMPPSFVAVSLRAGVSREDAEASASCLREAGLTAVVRQSEPSLIR